MDPRVTWEDPVVVLVLVTVGKTPKELRTRREVLAIANTVNMIKREVILFK